MALSTARPLLSASLIVKDEEVMLPRCLAALEGVVDEVVVYDTGSTDRTVEIAEAAGAVVHRGEWRDDFAWARNEALARCSGRWVVYVDADEELRVDDVAAFRRELARTDAEAFTVRIDNVEDHGGSITFTHDPVRLFRRARFTFEGRIHEHVVRRGASRFSAGANPALSILHHGYRPDVVVAKNKVQRNADLAEAAWQASPDDVLARIELARSLASTDRHEETLSHLRALREHGGDARHTALHLGIKLLLRTGELDEALAWAEELRRSAGHTVQSAKHHGEVLVKLGRLEEAVEVLQEAPEHGEDAGVHGTHETGAAAAVLRARVLHTLGRDDEAADLLVAVAATAPVSAWPLMLELLDGRGELGRAIGPFFDGLDQLGDDRARGVLAELSKVAVERVDAFFTLLAGEPDGLSFALAFVLANAQRFPLDRAVRWSSAARAAGLVDSCPLLRQADAATSNPLERMMAAATIAGAFDDARGARAIERIGQVLDDDEVTDALYVVSELAPQTLADLVAGYVTSQRKALVLANALTALGAKEEAAVVLTHALESCPPDPFNLDAITDTLVALGAPA
jgi:hypothetical protein